MFKTREITIVTLIAMFLFVMAIPSFASAASDRYRVKARLFGPTPLKGQARYEERPKNGSLERRFKVQVERGMPGDTHAIFVNGQLVATITTNGSGFEEFQYRTAAFIDSPGDGIPMPASFPSLKDGDVVTVGSMSATLRDD